MPWTFGIVAFLAGYGLMSLILWLLTSLGWLAGKPCTTSAVVMAGNDEHRIEGILRSLHRYWEEGRLLEILVAVETQDATRELVERLRGILSGITLLPAGTGADEILRAGVGETIWLIDLARSPGRTLVGEPPPFRRSVLRQYSSRCGWPEDSSITAGVSRSGGEKGR